MKKILAILLVGVLTLGLVVGCSNDDKERDKEKSNGKGGNDVTAEYNDEKLMEMMNQILDGADLEFMAFPMIEEDEDMMKFKAFISSLEHIQYMVSGDAMMNTVPYRLLLIKVDGIENVAALKEEIIENADLATWICAWADVAYVNSMGSVIFFVMAEQAEADATYAEFVRIAGNNIGDKLTRLAE